MFGRKVRISLLAQLCWLLAFFCLGLPASGQESAQGVVLRTGVLVDLPADMLYLMAPEGGLEAVALSDGQPIWSTEKAAQPLALTEQGLLALAETTDLSAELSLRILDVENQGRETLAANLALPDGVRVRVDEGLGERFRVAISADGRTVSWDYDYRQVRGALVEEEATTIRHQGLAAFDLAAGTLSAASNIAGDPQALLRPKRPDVPKAQQRQLGTSTGRQFFSADSRHILVSNAADQANANERYSWAIFEADSGNEIGSLRSASSWTPFVVTDGVVLREVKELGIREGEEWKSYPLRIEAVRLSDGQSLWSRALRQTAFRGPFPP